MSSTPSLKRATLKSGRGSRPGFSSSARMSLTVMAPKFSSAKASGFSASSTSPRPISSVDRAGRWRRSSSAPADRSRGARPVMSSGLSPSRMRRKPAACSKVLAPRPATSSSCCAVAEGAVRVAPAHDARRHRRATGPTRAPAAAPTRCSGPRRPSSRSPRPPRPALRASSLWFTSCWYWPTPMLFGSIFTSSASGSCRRRAMLTAPRRLTSRSGSSLLANSLAE